MKQVISLLGASFDYVSILSTDSVGWRIAIGQRSKAVTNSTMTTERGCVIRVCRDGLYLPRPARAALPHRDQALRNPCAA